jgi:hypothetical protein
MVVFRRRPSKQQLGRLDAFLAHLDGPQSTIARGMIDAGAKILVFWGPEQMDVWRLELGQGEVTVRFGIERGFSDGVEITHPRLRRRPPRDGVVPYIAAWMVWAWRTGVLTRAFDPAAPGAQADPSAWPDVVSWLRDDAREPDFTAIDDLWDRMREFSGTGYRMSHRMSDEERIAQVQKILDGSR